MRKFFFALALTTVIPAFAQASDGRQCRAILLGAGIDDKNCLDADNDLVVLRDAAFNREVCNPRVPQFTTNRHTFYRDSSSDNLIVGNCEWEIRANSGHADGFLADTNIIFRDPPQFGACDPSRDTGTRYVRDEEVCVAIKCKRYQLFADPKYAWVDPQPVDDSHCR